MSYGLARWKYADLQFTAHQDVSGVHRIRTVERREKLGGLEGYHPKSRFGEVHRREHHLGI